MTTLPRDAQGNVIQAMFPAVSDIITTSGTSAKTSAAFALGTRAIAVYCETNHCYIKLGPQASVVAAATDHFLPKDVWLVFSVMEDDVQATGLAAIQHTGAATLHVLELS